MFPPHSKFHCRLVNVGVLAFLCLKFNFQCDRKSPFLVCFFVCGYTNLIPLPDVGIIYRSDRLIPRRNSMLTKYHILQRH